jgi:SAM-dependent methyltransferase
MKLRDSGMPEEQYWETLFDVPLILDALEITSTLCDVAELGCGYGTFSIPIAQRIRGTLHTFDIDPAMVARTNDRGLTAGLRNVACQQRDVMECGFGLPPGSVDAALLFNILHCESPETLLAHAAYTVREGGHVLVIHWRHDRSTPRGPDLAIRPRPEQIVSWAQGLGKLRCESGVIELPPWHFGLRFLRLHAAAKPVAAVNPTLSP